MAKLLLEKEEVVAALRSARVVAVLGAHPDPARPAHYVPAYLAAHGYRVLPVNEHRAGEAMLGEVIRTSLLALGEAVDIVDVFRRSEDVPGHLDEILAMTPLPRVVWLQQGIRNDAAAALLIRAGIDVVQDRCILVDHRSWL